MSATKEMLLRMRESDFNELTEAQRSKFTYIEVRESNEYENNKNDINYLKLYKEQKKQRIICKNIYTKKDINRKLWKRTI